MCCLFHTTRSVDSLPSLPTRCNTSRSSSSPPTCATDLYLRSSFMRRCCMCCRLRAAVVVRGCVGPSTTRNVSAAPPSSRSAMCVLPSLSRQQPRLWCDSAVSTWCEPRSGCCSRSTLAWGGGGVGAGGCMVGVALVRVVRWRWRLATGDDAAMGEEENRYPERRRYLPNHQPLLAPAPVPPSLPTP